MKRLGIFGGTFDPIHRGHLHLAREFFQRLELDSLLLVPTKRPTINPPRIWRMRSTGWLCAGWRWNRLGMRFPISR